MSDAISGLGFQPKYLSLFTARDSVVSEESLISKAPEMEVIGFDEEGFNLLVGNTILRFNYSDAKPRQDPE